MKHILIPVLAIAALVQSDSLLAQVEGQPASGQGQSTTPSPKRAGRAKASVAPPAAPAAPTAFPAEEADSFSVNVSPGAPSAGNANYSWGYSRSVDSILPVIVDFSSLDDKTVQGLQEDLSIMTHLIRQNLEQGLGEEKPDIKMGLPILLSGARSVRALYLGDLGACFMIKVNFPVFGQIAPEVKPAAQPAPNDEWALAKKELEGESDRPASSGRGSAYNAEVVTAFQKQLIGTLKNATHIRHLKPNESVVISVFGGSQSSRDSQRSSSSLELSAAGSQGTVMTLRANKADVDAFAQGKLSEDDFRKKVKIAAYNGSGSDTTSINSWIKSGSSSLIVR